MRIMYKVLFFALASALLVAVGICSWMLIYTGDLPDTDHLSQFTPTSAVVISDPCQSSSSTAIPLERIGKNLREAIETAEPKWSWSTQVARSLFCNSKERTLWFQIDSWRVDWQMRRRFSENQLFTVYANRVYLGQDLYGVQNASQHYFHKDAGDLTVEEAALIAGVIKAPEAYSPFKSPEKALQRRNQVLAAMVAQGKLSPDEAARAETVPIPPRVENTYRSVEGTYRNPALGYSINVPRGLKATTGGEAGPERGLTISLPSGAKIVVFGEPNSLDWKTPAEGMQATLGREECSSGRREVSATRVGSLTGAKGSLACGDRVVKAFLAFRTGGGPIYWLRLDTSHAYASSDDNILQSIAASLKLIPWE
jgi:hypothetical protein